MVTQVVKRTIAFSAIGLGSVLIVVGASMLILNSNSAEKSISTTTTYPVANTSTQNTTVYRPPIKPQKTANPAPTPKPAPAMSVKWLRTVKGGYGERDVDEYKVILTAAGEYETGIPIVATTDYYVLDYATREGNTRVLNNYKSPGWYRNDGRMSTALYSFKTLVQDHDPLTYTLKLKNETDSRETLLILVDKGSKNCGKDDNEYHEAAARWAEQMKRKLK